jgi:hypothetical protein
MSMRWLHRLPVPELVIMDDPRRIVITGYGLVSALGDFAQTWEGLLERRVAVQRSSHRHAGFPFARAYSLAQPATDQTFASRSDLRAMGPSMRQTVLAAGMAIEHAGLRQRAEIVAAAGVFLGARHDARDWQADAAIAQEIAALDAYEPRLNELLSRGLRPGLFLAQLPNLFAGNLCIVFQIRGTSVTFLGEQGAGASALKHAAFLRRRRVPGALRARRIRLLVSRSRRRGPTADRALERERRWHRPRLCRGVRGARVARACAQARLRREGGARRRQLRDRATPRRIDHRQPVPAIRDRARAGRTGVGADRER